MVGYMHVNVYLCNLTIYYINNGILKMCYSIQQYREVN